MEACLVATDTNDLTFVLSKLFHTIDCYSGRFPELLFLVSSLGQLQQLSGEREDNLQALVGLQAYMENKLFDYYVIRNLYRCFQQDIEALKKNCPVNRTNTFYLESL